MLPRERKLLNDMFEAATTIEDTLRTTMVEHFLADPITRAAIYWNFMIVGEALSQLRAEGSGLYERIQIGTASLASETRSFKAIR